MYTKTKILYMSTLFRLIGGLIAFAIVIIIIMYKPDLICDFIYRLSDAFNMAFFSTPVIEN